MRCNPNISMSELYGKLRTDKGYSRHAASLIRVMKKLGYYVNKEKHTKYIPKYYDTPKELGIKWLLDVKYVPKNCYSRRDGQKFFQYTIIDEASKERFICPYKEQSSYSTVDFVKKAIVYVRYHILKRENNY